MNLKNGFSKAISLGALLFGAIVSLPASAGLIGFYTFEGNANDVSGNGNHGTLSATAPTLTAAGYQGSAYQFGSGGANTFVTLPIDINPGALPQVTFGAWVNADVADAVIRGIISHDNGDFDRTIDVDTRAGTPVKWCFFTGVGGGGICDGEVVVDDWVFLAVAYDATAGIGRFAVNGAHSANFTVTNGAGETQTTVGRNPNFDSPFVGRIDNVFFYDKFLSIQQLDDIRINGISLPEPATLALMGLGLAGIGYRRRRSVNPA